ncbi:uncharacterized protein EAE98_004415 [Botrytis deweyae]|uniref:Uncharacterized protein n=1 Tax=Botrytis deweyae TaxID=2478750 RepID=A0ABQ7IQT5_9HELO|nr:uncharacterized protein EAE98_004415 [Botrytis deweyae]KAF7931679.1 hypothetical protein EAE98_004415 [Botrytis deweyae]
MLVRLLSAIVAAHPTLKLDYAAISKYYGDESNYHQIWRGMNGIKRNAESLRKAVDAGLNASTVNLENDFSVKKAISIRFGGDCTASALDNRFRRLKSDAKLINAAVARGEDPILMNVGDTNGEVACKGKAISVLMGSATPASHIQSQLRETIKPLGERLIAMRDVGEDCKDVDLTDLGTRRYKAEIAAKMGSDVTPISVKAQFSRSFRVLGARQNALFAVGKDPKDASLDKLGSQQKSEVILSPEVAKYMGSDVTPIAIKIKFNATIRALSRRQIALFDAGKDPLDVSLSNPKGETARIMGSDTTPSSLQNHFRRTVKVLCKRQMSMLAAGQDSMEVSLDGLGGEIVAIMGSDVTVDAIKQQIGKRIKVLGSRQTKMRAAGQDPKRVDLEGLMPAKKEQGEMDKFMGDSTMNGLRFQFDTRYKVIAKRQKAMFAAGENPSTVDIVTGGKTEVQKCFGSDATAGGIKFQFATTIKKHVDQIRSARAAGKDCKDITFNSNGLLIYTFHCGH